MMKNFKLLLLSFAIIAGLLSSCSNNESLVDEQNIDETEAIVTSLNRLSQQFNDDGYVITSANPAGNIIFDFGFDFVYPLNLSFNNGTTVSVNSLDELIDILINSTENLYINGIEFPFDVEVYNEDTDAIEIITINNEDEFLDLINSLDWDGQDSCDCFEDYNPVCVEIEAPDGESFTITYPNECYALCDGFTPNDFIENCANDGNNVGGFDCFEFVFPLTIVTNENQTITVNSQEELDSVLYNAYYFDFVYTFDVMVNGELLTIGNEEAFINLLENCFENGGCPCPGDVNPVCVEITTPSGGTEIITFLNACEAECEGFTPNDFVNCDNNNPCDACENEEFIPVCVQVEVEGELVIYTFPNECYALCEGFTPNNFVDCNNNNPGDCSEQELSDYLLECNWYFTTSLYDATVQYAQFFQDGTVTVNDEATGSWNTASNPSTAEVFMFLIFNDAPYNSINQLDWTVVQCSEGFIVLESGNEFIMLERSCD